MDRPELELQKLKADLERTRLENQKLERDLKLEKPFTERPRFWAETFRLVAITIITAGISLIVSSQTEEDKSNYEMRLEEFKEFLRIKKEFENPMTNFEDKKRIACDLSLDFSQIERPSVKKFITKVSLFCSDSSINKKEQEITRGYAQAQQNTPMLVINKLNETEEKLSKVTQEIKNSPSDQQTQLKVEQTKLVKAMDSLVNFSPDLLALSNQSKDVETLYTAQAENINREIRNSTNYDTYPRSSWFKQGYFIVFEDMKIVLNKINSDHSIQVSICKSTDPNICPPGSILKAEESLTTSDPIQIETAGATYIIRLDRIGRAGKNPFTKAAYITFEKVIKP